MINSALLRTISITLLFCFVFLGSWWRYITYGFYSDGYLYWDAIRNLAQHGSFYSGPVMENLLGNHAYITLFLLTPLVWIFNSPFLMVVISVFSYAATVFLTYRVSVTWSITLRSNLLVAVAIGLFPPLFAGIVSEQYMFQPDCLVPPFSLLVLYSAVNNRWTSFYVSTALLILTKEDMVLFGPIWAYLCLFYVDSKSVPNILSKKKLLKLACIAAVSTLIIYISYNYSDNLNFYHFINSEDHRQAVLIRFIAELPTILKYTLLEFLLFTLFLGFMYGLGFPLNRLSQKQKVLTASLVILALMRIGFNISVYSFPPKIIEFYWGNYLLVPIYLMGIIVMFSPDRLTSKRRPLHRSLVFVATIGLSFYMSSDTILMLARPLIKKPYNVELFSERKDYEVVSGKLGDPSSLAFSRYIIVPNGAERHFPNWSTAPTTYVIGHTHEERLTRNASLIIIPCRIKAQVRWATDLVNKGLLEGLPQAGSTCLYRRADLNPEN